jgi:hypothetical protein
MLCVRTASACPSLYLPVSILVAITPPSPTCTLSNEPKGREAHREAGVDLFRFFTFASAISVSSAAAAAAALVLPLSSSFT